MAVYPLNNNNNNNSIGKMDKEVEYMSMRVNSRWNMCLFSLFRGGLNF